MAGLVPAIHVDPGDDGRKGGTKMRSTSAAKKTEKLRKAIKAGIDDLDRGDFIEIDEGKLARYLESLASAADAPKK